MRYIYSPLRLLSVLFAIGIYTAGCATIERPENTCGEPPANLSRDLSGEEFVKRARAWESYALCLESLTGPSAPITIEPDMRPIPKPNPWDAAYRENEDRVYWALPSRSIRQARREGEGPFIPQSPYCGPHFLARASKQYCAA